MPDPIEQTLDVVERVSKALPVYDDMLKPAAQELGKGLVTVAKTVNMVLAPLKMVVWGYERIEDWLETEVSNKLKDVPPERIQTPAPNVAGPAIEAMRFVGNEPDLRNLYANLLKTAMDTETAEKAHPGFVEIIKQLTPDEARIVNYLTIAAGIPVIELRDNDIGNRNYSVEFRNVNCIVDDAGCSSPALGSAYLDNLCRLQIIEPLAPGTSFTKPGVYDRVEQRPDIVARLKAINEANNSRGSFIRGGYRTTDWGKLFCAACVDIETPKEGE
jgi:Abortive infection alpha